MKKTRQVGGGKSAAVFLYALLTAAAAAATFLPAQLVRDIETRLIPSGSYPRQLCSRNDNSTLLTSEDDPGHARLWRTNGTPGSTALIADLSPTTVHTDFWCAYPGTSGPQFIVRTGDPGPALLAINSAGTSVTKVYQGSDGYAPALLGVASLPIFAIASDTGPTRLLVSDGSAANTVVIATIPILILYIFFQRYFVEGIAASGVKG